MVTAPGVGQGVVALVPFANNQPASRQVTTIPPPEPPLHVTSPYRHGPIPPHVTADLRVHYATRRASRALSICDVAHIRLGRNP